MRREFPRATYRLQLTPRFGLDAARRLLPYFSHLGVDTLYLSPIAAARRGSRHGYDTVDPGRVDRARGGAPAWRRLDRAAQRAGIGLLLDIVPNHLAASLENRAWVDLLRHGTRSRFAGLFDVEWRPGREGIGQVTLPWLDRPLSDALHERTVALELRGNPPRASLRCGRERLPVSPVVERQLLGWARMRAGRCRSRRERIGPALHTVVGKLNRGGDRWTRAQREHLLGLLPYRLVPWWDLAAINYRRFFDVSDLVGVRSDEPFGFDHMHRWLFRTGARSSSFRGVRVDHVDGIRDPLAYLRSLHERLNEPSGGQRQRGSIPYVVVEKILAPEEELPRGWPVAGTTGYDALHLLGGVLIPSRSLGRLDAAYRAACGPMARPYSEVVYHAKRDVERTLFPSERARLVAAARTEARGRAMRGVSEAELDDALCALTASLPVYRTYARQGRWGPADREVVAAALESARRREGRRGRGLHALEQVIATPPRSGPLGSTRGFVDRWQQWSSAIAAKGAEDTAFYRHARLVGANEVGADPGRVVVPLDEFHRAMRRRAARWPHALTATSTHDTKWGEDARARFVALAEWASAWGRSARHWRRVNRRWRSRGGREGGPDPREEFRLYQSILATAPPTGRFPREYIRRLRAYWIKSAREAKERTSWLHPQPAHEQGLHRFLDRLASSSPRDPFRQELSAWIERISAIGAYYSLAQAILRNTVPGVPDLYQGSEGWNHSFVDPDNRRPIPYGPFVRRLRRLEEGWKVSRVGGGTTPPAWPHRHAEAKLWLTWRLLRLRKVRWDLFASGDYQPLWERNPPRTEPVLAYSRRLGKSWLVVVIGRELARLSDGGRRRPVGSCWHGRRISIPPGAPRLWSEVLTGRRLRPQTRGQSPSFDLEALFRSWPFAVLVGGATRGTMGTRE